MTVHYNIFYSPGIPEVLSVRTSKHVTGISSLEESVVNVMNLALEGMRLDRVQSQCICTIYILFSPRTARI